MSDLRIKLLEIEVKYLKIIDNINCFYLLFMIATVFIGLSYAALKNEADTINNSNRLDVIEQKYMYSIGVNLGKGVENEVSN